MRHVIGISEAEALRWRQYGPDADIVQHYLREGTSIVSSSALLEKLPSPHELIEALDQSLIDVKAMNRAAEVSGFNKVSSAELLPISFLFEYFRLEEVTGMFDYNLKTGHLIIDWSCCDEALLREAVEVGAVSELSLRCKGGTIYLNNGSYVDAVLNSAEDSLRNMLATDVIFELFRISTAGLPGAGARQFEGGPESTRIPEVINLRPNKFNLDLTKRLDHMRSGKSDNDVAEDELDLDAAFAAWESPTVQPSEVDLREKVIHEDADHGDERLVTVSVDGCLSSVAALLSCEDVVSLELGVVECLASVGLAQSRIEIVLAESGETLRECGLSRELCDVWRIYGVGTLSVVVAIGKNIRVDKAEAVDVIMQCAVQRLRTLPGRKLIGGIDSPGFIAEDPRTQSVLSQLREIAVLDGRENSQRVSVLLLGERGTGKELLARLVHEWSGRRSETFQVVNLGAIADQLAPAEIFGSKKGSFTGSVGDRIGYIQRAEKGTLFLDELDEADDSTQALLKRVVQFGTYNVVGCPDESSCNVRFVAATNRGLNEEGCIKADLRDRFWIVQIPPLRERRADISPLAQYFAGQHNYTLPEPVLSYLSGLQWPGNVRQLQTVVERVCAVVKSADEVNLASFESAVKESGNNPSLFNCGSQFSPLGVGETLEDRQNAHDEWHITYALNFTNWNKAAAARMLGMSRQVLGNRMKALGMSFDRPQK